MKKIIITLAVLMLASVAFAAPGDLLATVELPGNGGCSVAGTFDGTYYITIQTDACEGEQILIYLPPVGDGAATLVATKNIVDGSGNPVTLSALSWDDSRAMLWGAFLDAIWLVDLGDKTVDGNAVATFQFNPGVDGIDLVDGLAYDLNDDTLYYSPDVNLNVYQFALGTGANPPLGTLMNTISPQNDAGVADGSVSGVAIGGGNSLYIGRNGFAEIRRVDKTTGAFMSTFATTIGRVEDLVCDPVTYYPLEAILAKNAYDELYEAFEVEPGTCPLIDITPPEVQCIETVNPHGNNVPPAGSTTLPGPKGGQNEDGFYELSAIDNFNLGVQLYITDQGSGTVFGPFETGTIVKITEDPDAIPMMKKIGSDNGKAGAVDWHLILNGDAIVSAVDAAGNVATIECLVPQPPK